MSKLTALLDLPLPASEPKARAVQEPCARPQITEEIGSSERSMEPQRSEEHSPLRHPAIHPAFAIG